MQAQMACPIFHLVIRIVAIPHKREISSCQCKKKNTIPGVSLGLSHDCLGYADVDGGGDACRKLRTTPIKVSDDL